MSRSGTAGSRTSDYVFKMQLLHHLQTPLSSSSSKLSPRGSTDYLSSFRCSWFFALAVFRRRDPLSTSPTSVPLKWVWSSAWVRCLPQDITVLGRIGYDGPFWLKFLTLRGSHHMNDSPPDQRGKFPKREMLGRPKNRLLYFFPDKSSFIPILRCDICSTCIQISWGHKTLM